jgi:hypothetical protein
MASACSVVGAFQDASEVPSNARRLKLGKGSVALPGRDAAKSSLETQL